ncbi:MAG: RdgB/HAM1 family non-canonical purine NTP pyrophosphatase [Actinobacteria bacterium]|nr:RdgB/HAM1 family non-canonical purine NTP pyrophosphatase [Actinomycetota bacterium]NBP11853.1 RdgB/HAM1 family non-canonical purine NTP pyrophosphatase [Actinomycetota bacterium]NBP22025.1 RdgB/HAM1 family non-canonical purine NTP pyrophosphatase [Actinomycetota bacterium]NBP42910.1 RdgB/HAM1 family non-canonical purine NTP pyrophosphatase [Actinomycetota bacterium]NBQ00655.1 RdgB/HAM1 family non-canonical purine NTP pyrophosphatase [Actinomycetota bacterium]
MKKTLVLATRNKGKVLEVERMLKIHAPEISLISMADLDIGDIEETGNSFEENALLKARTVTQISGLAALADDSGLAIDALNGEPGIFSARYSGVHGDDAANNAKVLRQMAGITKRSASFIAVLALSRPDGQSIISRGELLGQIIDSPRGNQGFGYDPIFQPTGFDITTAQMSPEMKDSISHRGKALAQIAPKISPFLSLS